MFNFGNPEDTAALFLQTRLQMTGPGMPEGHLDELSEKDARIVMAYLYGAVSAALREGLGDAEVKVLVTWYDEVFQRLTETSEAFLEKVAQGAVLPPQGAKHRYKYLVLAGLASEN